MRHLHLPRKAILGFACWYLAGLGWLGDIILPFTNLPHKSLWFLGLLIFAEACFALGIVLLGQTYYRALKTRLMSFVRTRFK